MDFYLGTILLWSGAWVPSGWALCDGRLVQIQQFQALYSIIGTVYGGDGRTTFALPDLRGRFPIGAGMNPATRTWQPGEHYDSTMEAQIGLAQMPQHFHQITDAVSVKGGADVPVSLNIAVPVNTDSNSSKVSNPTGNNCSLTDGKAGSPSTKIFTTDQPTPGATLRPFSVQTNISVPAPTITVTSTCQPAGQEKPIPVNVAPPLLCLQYIICIEGGAYPPRD